MMYFRLCTRSKAFESRNTGSTTILALTRESGLENGVTFISGIWSKHLGQEGISIDVNPEHLKRSGSLQVDYDLMLDCHNRLGYVSLRKRAMVVLVRFIPPLGHIISAYEFEI